MTGWASHHCDEEGRCFEFAAVKPRTISGKHHQHLQISNPPSTFQSDSLTPITLNHLQCTHPSPSICISPRCFRSTGHHEGWKAGSLPHPQRTPPNEGATYLRTAAGMSHLSVGIGHINKIQFSARLGCICARQKTGHFPHQ